MIPLLIAIAVGPMLAWKRGDLLGALQRLWVAFAVAIVVMLILFYVTRGGPVLAVLGLGLAAWVGMGALVEFAERLRLFRSPWRETWRRALNSPRASYGMTIAHFGMAVTVAGIAASAFEQRAHQMLHVGQGRAPSPATSCASTISAGGTAKITPPTRGEFTLLKGGQVVAELKPERRFFPLQQQTVAKTAIHTNLLADFYLALGDPDSQGGWTMRAYWKPLVPFIWIGGVIMAFGGAVSLRTGAGGSAWRRGAWSRAHCRPAEAGA